MTEAEKERAAIVRRLLHTSQGDWLSRYDTSDEEWMPPRMHMAFIRMGVVSSEPHPEGGYMLTPLGMAVVEELRPGSDAWLRQSPNFHPGDIA